MAKAKQNNAPLWRGIFLVYLGVMLWLLFGRGRGWDHSLSYQEILKARINLKPFYTVGNYLSVVLHMPNSPYFRQCIIELTGNLLLFIPAGWLLPRIFQKMRRFFPFLLTTLCTVFLIEAIQLFTLLGTFDVDDVILNMTGILIGFICFTVLTKHRKNINRK